MSTETMSIAQMIEHYISLRDHKDAANKEFKKSMERVNQAMEKLEGKLLEHLENEGTESAKAKGVGTAYIRVVSSMKTTDRDAFLKYCLQNRDLDAMDVRPVKSIINEKLENGEDVPGVQVTQTRLIGVRRG